MKGPQYEFNTFSIHTMLSLSLSYVIFLWTTTPSLYVLIGFLNNRCSLYFTSLEQLLSSKPLFSLSTIVCHSWERDYIIMKRIRRPDTERRPWHTIDNKDNERHAADIKYQWSKHHTANRATSSEKIDASYTVLTTILSEVKLGSISYICQETVYHLACL